MIPTVGALPWYKSSVYIGAVVTTLSTLAVLAPKAAAALGLTSPDAINATVNSVFEVITLVAGVFTGIQRARSTVQPLTATASAAEAHPTTAVAVQQGTKSP